MPEKTRIEKFAETITNDPTHRDSSNRDPQNIHNYILIDFEDIIAEADATHSVDW